MAAAGVSLPLWTFLRISSRRFFTPPFYHTSQVLGPPGRGGGRSLVNEGQVV
jgi:hypothetical protein